jgi:hypothetical protein
VHGHYKELVLRADDLSLRAYVPKAFAVQAGDDVAFSFRCVRQFTEEPQTGRPALEEGPSASREVGIRGPSGVELPEGR